MEFPENVTTASGKQGAHNMPCKKCGKVNWKQNTELDGYGYPLWDCQTEKCNGVLWSD